MKYPEVLFHLFLDGAYHVANLPSVVELHNTSHMQELSRVYVLFQHSEYICVHFSIVLSYIAPYCTICAKASLLGAALTRYKCFLRVHLPYSARWP